MQVEKKLELLRRGKLSVTENVRHFLNKIKRENYKINAFIDIKPKIALEKAKYLDENREKLKDGKLFGLCIAVKASINVKGYNVSCSSNALKNYIAPYNATVISRIEEDGGVIIGITNCDEFCCGGSGETSAFGPVQNPFALGLIPGGSSSGSAAAVAAGFCDMALGSDTGGSIRNPASHCGVVGLKPTYSSVSRYGLIDLSMSLDQIGPLAKNVDDAELLLNVIKGKDECDSISQSQPSIPRPTHDLARSFEATSRNRSPTPKNINQKSKSLFNQNLTIGILDLSDLKVDKRISDLINEKIERVVKKTNWKLKKIKINYIDLAVETYYPLVYVEFFSGTRKFDGRRYGIKIEDVAGSEVLRRILGGSEITKAEHHGRYYYQSLKAKKLIEEEFAKAFKSVDCIVLPTVPCLPWKIGEKISVEEMYAADVLTVPANLAGCCAVSIPAGFINPKPSNPQPTHDLARSFEATSRNRSPTPKINGIPVGLQIMCDKFQDEKMLGIAREVEKL